MGSSASQEDERQLLDEDEEILPIFEELKLVLIGSQGAGKNAIANAIFGEKVFTFWTSYKYNYVKETRTVSGTQIHLTRTPGWRGDLSRSEQTKREIVYCVQALYKTGPHAIILVLNVNSVLSESNISTLESLLTVQLWEHTIVLFTHGEKLGGYTIDAYIKRHQLEALIDKCGKRYFVIQNNDSNQIIEKIEDHIVRKNSTSCFKLSAQTDDKNALLSDWKYLVERIKSKIAYIKETLKKEQNEDSKDAEIRRLKKILQEKEREMEKLQSEISRIQEDPDSSFQCRKITEMEYQVLCNKLKDSNTKNERQKEVIEELKNELQICKQKAVGQWTQEDQYATVHTGYRSELCQDLTTVATRNQNQIQLQALHSKGSAPHNWSDTLLEVLEKLTQYELKKMKYYMCTDENSIPMGSLEGKDRVDLARLMLTQWGKRQSVLKTRDLMKKIPHKDDDMIELIEPHLKSIGETWS